MRDALALIRFGYGLGPQRRGLAADTLLAGLRDPDAMAVRYPLTTREEARAAVVTLRQLTRALDQGQDGAKAAYDAHQAQISEMVNGTFAAFIGRCLDSQTPFRERLTMFWADHFTIHPRNRAVMPLIGSYLTETIQPHLTGRFGDMLKAVIVDPSMLVYLDQVSSVGPNSAMGRKRNRGLNENLARELLELHSVGVGGAYTQADVRQAAELLTGLSYTARDGFRFRADRAEPGPETVLGRDYGGGRRDGLDAILTFLDDLAVRPDTARHVSGKLATHFVSDTPDPAMVAAMTTAWIESSGDLPSVYEAMLDHPSAWAPDLAKVKQPMDYIISGVQALGIAGSEVTALSVRQRARYIAAPMRRMGQRFFRAPGPDGWPERAEAWVTPQGLATRIRWAMEVSGKVQDRLPDPRKFVETALGPLVDERLRWAASASETRAQGVALVLASPAFNRR